MPWYAGRPVATVTAARHPYITWRSFVVPTLTGIAHVALSVTDLDSSARWYAPLLGGAAPVIADETDAFRRQVYALPSGQLFALYQHAGVTAGDRFDPARAGLDHLSFSCADRAEVEAWEKQFTEAGATCDGIVDFPFGTVLSVKDPDGNALEFYAPPAG